MPRSGTIDIYLEIRVKAKLQSLQARLMRLTYHSEMSSLERAPTGSSATDEQKLVRLNYLDQPLKESKADSPEKQTLLAFSGASDRNSPRKDWTT